jgi:hypothetical protein
MNFECHLKMSMVINVKDEFYRHCNKEESFSENMFGEIIRLEVGCKRYRDRC